jgi:signal transduction histidine kinase
MSERIDRRLASLLEERSGEITRRWHEQLREMLELRPNNIFPGEALLDGMPPMVEWLTRSLRNGSGPGEANEDSLREVAEHWRTAGFTVEESLLHFRLLADLLFDTLGELADADGVQVSATEGVRAASRLCHAIDVAQVVLVATYRDAEEQRITTFSETLAHEVRDQLAAALTSIQVVRTLREDVGTQLSPEREDELLGGAEGALQRATEVVSAVRSVSETGVGRAEWWKMRGLGELVRQIVDDINAKATSGVELAVDPELPEVRVPEDPVSLVLHNLVENAVKYADPEKEERWVRVQARREGDGHLVVQVGDNGLGIPEAEQTRIFNRFHRGARRQGSGFGLGLSIARRAAHSIGGRMMLESEEGAGSTFGFTIPAESLGDPA